MAPRGQRLPAARKVERDAKLLKDRASGMTWKKVAAKYDLTEPGARRIWAEYRDTKMPEIQGQDAIDVVFETLERYETWQGQLAEIAASTKGTARIGAIRAQMDCEARKIDLRQATGMMPKHLGKIAVDFDVRYVVTRVLALFDRYDLPPEAQRELLEVINKDH